MHLHTTVTAVSDVNQTTSSYTPVVSISSPPNPVLTVLEPDCNVDAKVDDVYVSSIFSGPNQIVNLIPSSHQDSKLEPNFGTLSSVAASVLGSFPDGSGVGGTNWSSFNGKGYTVDDVIVSGTFIGVVNEASSMDVSGFVNMVMSGSPNDTHDYLMSSISSGLCMSGLCGVTSGAVEYSMLLGSGDVGLSNFYGGIYNMGLWTIDMNESLKAGNTPPYSFGPLDNPRKYKLFATKHLTKNLGFINDHNNLAGALNYKDLTIKWRLHFV